MQVSGQNTDFKESCILTSIKFSQVRSAKEHSHAILQPWIFLSTFVENILGTSPYSELPSPHPQHLTVEKSIVCVERRLKI